MLRKLCFLGTLLVLHLAFVEVALQLFYRVSNGDWLIRRVDLPIFEPDDVRVYRVKSNLDYEHISNEFRATYHTDDFGFRARSSDTVTRVRKEPGTYRIVFLGPSFDFGIAGNYEEIYVTRIERQLLEAGYDIDIINVGTPAQPIRWQLCWVEEFARRFEPDLIVQTVYGDPVLRERRCDKSPPLAHVEGGRLYLSTPSLRKKAIAVAKKFATVFYSWYLYQIHFTGDGGDGSGGRQGLGTELYQPGARNALTPDGILASYRGYLDTIRSSVGPDPDIAFLYVPFSYMVHEADTSRFAHLGATPPGELIASRKLVSETLNANGIVFIDPFDALRANAASRRQYHFIDVHVTPAGNASLANHAAPVIAAIIETSRAEGADPPP